MDIIAFLFGIVLFIRDLNFISTFSTLPAYSNLTTTVDVPFGKSAVIDFNGIRSYLASRNETLPIGRCWIRVVGNEPIYSRVGYLEQTNFTCWTANATYTHLGYESPNEDTVKLRMAYYSPTDFVEHTLFIMLRILDRNEGNLFLKGFPLRINEKSDGDETAKFGQHGLSRKSVLLSRDDFPDSCHISIVTRTPFPRFGHLNVESDTRLPCQQFFAGEIHYKLTAEIFSSHDLVILRCEILDANGTLSTEHVQMPIRIEHGEENSPPEIAFSALTYLDVQNFVIKSISRDVLLAEDKDGASEDLVYRVVQTPALEEGFLVRLDDPVHPIESFTQKDVNLMKIAFRPPTMDAAGDRVLEDLILEIVDVEGLISEPVALVVVIKPAVYSAPFVIFNKGLTLYEGESATLWTWKNLAIGDEDNLDEVSVRVTGGLAHGRLLNADKSVKQFVVADLETGKLRYQHDGSGTFDSIILQMNDGQHQVEFLISVTIISVDDDAPVLLANIGILVHAANETVPVTSKILRATDFDSDDESIRYTVNSENEWGIFFLTGEKRTDVVSWTERDITRGNLHYQHRGDARQTTTTWYTLDFSLQDNATPPNLSPHFHTLTVTFVPQDRQAPQLSPTATMVLRVNASEVAIIGNGIFSFVDDFTRARNILLIVRSPPRLGSLIWAGASGHNSDQDIPELFPQSCLSYGEIVYQAPSLPLTADGPSSTPVVNDSLVVDVRDKQGNVLTGQKLEIFVEAPRGRKARNSHKTPAVVSKLVVVKEGQVASLSDYLLISDPDTHLSAIHLKIVQTPANGVLQLNNKSLAMDESFTADHIRMGGITYKNSQMPTRWEDFARFNITTDDSIEELTTVMTFRIVPSEDEPKSKKSKLGLSKLGLVIQVTEGGEFIFTSTTILGSAHANRYPPRDLIFELVFSPRNGALLRSGTKTNKFSWKDVENHLITYRSATKIDQEDNILFDDTLSFRLIPSTDEWVLSDKVIDHLEIQILLVPRSATITIGKPFIVEESQSAVLTEEYLVVVAPNQQPVACSLVQAPLYGQLFDVIAKERVEKFSNFDIREHRIHYQQNVHQQLEPNSDSIRLNCAGNWVEVPVTIQPVNDEPPVLVINHIHVSAKNKVLLGAFITLLDADEPADNLTVDIIKFPQHGFIAGNFTTLDTNEIQLEPVLRQIRTFSAEDLLLPERIYYQHDGSRVTSDKFVLRASDGINVVEKEVEVTVHGGDEDGPTNDDPSYGYVEIISSPVELVGAEQEIRYYNSSNYTTVMADITTPAPVLRIAMPNISFSPPVRPLTLLPNKHLGIFLTEKIIRVERDNTSTERDLLFEIVKPPKSGVFLDVNSPDRIVNVFTESVLKQETIAYALFPENEDATEDNFTFHAINEFGKRSKLMNGRFNWSWISFAVDKVDTNEMLGIVTVGVRRRGSIQSRDFVSVKARDLTATMGRDYKEDFALQAEFQPEQNETFIDIKILKDEKYEDREHFQLMLEEPQLANVEKPFVVTITITDQDDGALVYIPLPLYFVKEDVGIYNLTIKRSGKDLTNPLSVICYTTDGTASGTISRHQQIFRPDFVSRLNIHSSAVTFARNESTQICPIVIVNDGVAEDDERLYVNIRPLGNARIGIYQQTELVILRDMDDEPSISFSKPEYTTTVFDHFVDVQVDRKGGDMSQPSEVDIISEEGKRIESVYFGQGESSQTVTLKSMGHFNVTNDVFRVYLNNSHSAQIPSPNFATIHVRKTMNFTMLSTLGNGALTENEVVLLGNYDRDDGIKIPKPQYECINCNKPLQIPANNNSFAKPRKVMASPLPSSERLNKTKISDRSPEYHLISPGWEDFLTDLTKPKYVRFYPESELADKTDDSWKDGMIDTSPKESISVVPVMRGAALSPLQSSAIIPARKLQAAKPKNGSMIGFAKPLYEAYEPLNNRQTRWISLLVTRTGNLSMSDSVRVVTKNGSARAGYDFEPVDTVLNFVASRSQEILQIRVIHDNVRETSENFTVHIYPLRRTLADVTKAMTTVTIHEQSGANVRFPGAPLVTNLNDYERPVPGGWIAIGQPVICITTCNPRHPDFNQTKRICDMEEIDDSQTGYTWKVSHPTDDDELTLEPLERIRSSTWFADVNEQVLDSIYFTNGSIVQCTAHAVTKKGQIGFESTSGIVTAVSINAKCPYSLGRMNAVNIDPYQASISTTKSGDVKITVIIPHRTGLVPLVSTTHIADDLHLMLSTDGTRMAEHPCSTMISQDELRTSNGFLKYRSSRDGGGKSALEKLRGNKTLEFYRNLDLNNCRWTFDTTYSMSEVLNLCGGKLISDSTRQTASQREVSIQLPLYVSYAYFTNFMRQPWKHYAQSTTLDIVFTYNSGILWSPESPLMGPLASAPQLPSALAGPDNSANTDIITPFPAELKVLQAKIEEEGHHINVRFKTKPKFRGKFVMHDSKRKISSHVNYTTSPATAFELKLLRTQETNAQPQQLWRFRTLRSISRTNLVGMYNITLLPCEFPAKSINNCTIQSPVVFNVYISDS